MLERKVATISHTTFEIPSCSLNRKNSFQAAAMLGLRFLVLKRFFGVRAVRRKLEAEIAVFKHGKINDPDKTLPWGSLPKPAFGAVRASTNLSPVQTDALIREYLPQDRVEICRQRASIIKEIHRLMKTKRFGPLVDRLTELRSGVVPLDESTFVAMVFGHLQLPEGLIQAESIVVEMCKNDFIHPSLKETVASFVNSLRTLEQFDAFPNRTALLKAYIPFAEIARDVRKMRILAFKVAMSDRIKKGEVVLPATPDKDSTDDDELDELLDESLHDS